MVVQDACPVCGCAVTKHLPLGICPACLLCQSLGDESGPAPEDVPPAANGEGGAPGGDRPDGRRGRRRPSRIRLFEEIARGGMGAIHRGRDDRLNRDLAVKVLLDRHRGRASVRRRFFREAQITGQLQHPGIVPVYELGRFDGGRPYIAMKLVEGRTLAAMLAGRLGPAHDLHRFLAIFLQVCQTMAYAHSRRVIHRDLTPSNVMVGPFGEVQVLDWGLAKALDGSDVRADPEPCDLPAPPREGLSTPGASRAGSALGTPGYMSPEQARGDLGLVDERTDVFGLGSVLCQILTGFPAHEGDSAQDVFRMALKGEVGETLARLAISGADEDLVALARDCLAEDPANRPGDAGAVASRVERHLESVEARLHAAELARASADARAAEERARRRLTMTLALVMLAVVALGSAGTAAYSRHRQGLRDRASAVLRRAEVLRDEAAADPGGDPARWSAAQLAASQAAGLLADAPEPAALARLAGLARQVDRGLADAQADRRLVEQLEEILTHDESTEPDAIDARYAEAFRARGFDLARDDPAAVGRAIGRRPAAVVAGASVALDDWAMVVGDIRRQRGRLRPLLAARAADPDPWRNRLRDALEDTDGAAMVRLARSPDRASLPASSLYLLAHALSVAVKDPEHALEVLSAAQAAHPGDYLINAELCNALMDHPERAREALRFGFAAIALRPGRSSPHLRLGTYFSVIEHDSRAAEAEYRTAIRLKPDYSFAHYLLGSVLWNQSRFDEAEAAYRESLRLKPECGDCQIAVGNSLTWQGRPDLGLVEIREVYRREPWYPVAQEYLRAVLIELDRFDEAAALARQVLRERPGEARPHAGLGSILRRRDPGSPEAEAEFRKALLLDGQDAEATRGLVRVLLARGDVRGALQAVRLAEQAAPAGSGLASAVADLRRSAELAGRLPGILQGADHPADSPERVELAELCRDRGAFAEAAGLLADAFEGDPELPRDFRRGLRFQAACCAALAATPAVEPESRARWRRQALLWLRSDLAEWSQSADGGPAPARFEFARNLRGWETIDDLKGVRDPAAIAGLPDPERADWQAFWSDVRAHADRAIAAGIAAGKPPAGPLTP